MRIKTDLPVMIAITVVVLFMGLATLSINGDQEQYHCDMVSLWVEDEKLGYEPNDRRGWPDYKEVCGYDD